MKTVRRRALLFGAAGAIAAFVLPRPVFADEKADRVARELVTALGGETAWQKARQLRFDFVVEREGTRVAEFHHLWDRYTGDYRLLGTDKSGAPYAVYFNVNTREGSAFVNGRQIEGEEKKKLLETAYGRFINDTYWLLAPWKVFDPGVHRDYDGEKTGWRGNLCAAPRTCRAPARLRIQSRPDHRRIVARHLPRNHVQRALARENDGGKAAPDRLRERCRLAVARRQGLRGSVRSRAIVAIARDPSRSLSRAKARGSG